MHSLPRAERIPNIHPGRRLSTVDMHPRQSLDPLPHSNLFQALCHFPLLRPTLFNLDYPLNHPGSSDAIPNRLPYRLPSQDTQDLASDYGMPAFDPDYVKHGRIPISGVKVGFNDPEYCSCAAATSPAKATHCWNWGRKLSYSISLPGP